MGGDTAKPGGGLAQPLCGIAGGVSVTEATCHPSCRRVLAGVEQSARDLEQWAWVNVAGIGERRSRWKPAIPT
jgi:hypothetical protein